MSKPEDWRGPGALYRLTDPREPDRVRYVGITTKEPYKYNKDRYRHSVRPSCKLDSRLYRWLRKLNREGIEPVVHVTYLEDATWHELRAAEIKAILIYRTAGHDLVNGTDGGELVIGGLRSDETRAKLSTAIRRAYADDPTLGSRIAAARAATMIERYGTLSPSAFVDPANRGSTWRGKTLPDEIKEKMSQSHKSRWARYREEGRDEEIRANIAEGTRRAMADPEVRARVSAGNRGRTPWNKGIGKNGYVPPAKTPEEKAQRLEDKKQKNSEHSKSVWAGYTEEERQERGRRISEGKFAGARNRPHSTPRNIYIGEARGLGISIGKNKGKAARNGWILPIVAPDTVTVLNCRPPKRRVKSSTISP